MGGGGGVEMHSSNSGRETWNECEIKSEHDEGGKGP